MFKTTFQTLLRIKSIIKVNKKVDYVEPGEYVVHNLFVEFTKPNMRLKPSHVTYLLENLANDNRDDDICEDVLEEAIKNGDIEVLSDDIVSYKVEYIDITDNNTPKHDYVYVKAETEVSEAYFYTRVLREFIVTEINPIKFAKHEIKITNFDICLR